MVTGSDSADGLHDCTPRVQCYSMGSHDMIKTQQQLADHHDPLSLAGPHHCMDITASKFQQVGEGVPLTRMPFFWSTGIPYYMATSLLTSITVQQGWGGAIQGGALLVGDEHGHPGPILAHSKLLLGLKLVGRSVAALQLGLPEQLRLCTA